MQLHPTGWVIEEWVTFPGVDLRMVNPITGSSRGPMDGYFPFLIPLWDPVMRGICTSYTGMNVQQLFKYLTTLNTNDMPATEEVLIMLPPFPPLAFLILSTAIKVKSITAF